MVPCRPLHSIGTLCDPAQMSLVSTVEFISFSFSLTSLVLKKNTRPLINSYGLLALPLCYQIE
jgi:hypothetical protein